MTSDAISAIGIIGLVASVIAAWATYIGWVIIALMGDATTSQMVLGAIGAFMPPVGIVHGYMIWFGAGF